MCSRCCASAPTASAPTAPPTCGGRQHSWSMQSLPPRPHLDEQILFAQVFDDEPFLGWLLLVEQADELDQYNVSAGVRCAGGWWGRRRAGLRSQAAAAAQGTRLGGGYFAHKHRSAASERCGHAHPVIKTPWVACTISASQVEWGRSIGAPMTVWQRMLPLAKPSRRSRRRFSKPVKATQHSWSIARSSSSIYKAP